MHIDVHVTCTIPSCIMNRIKHLTSPDDEEEASLEVEIKTSPVYDDTRLLRHPGLDSCVG